MIKYFNQANVFECDEITENIVIDFMIYFKDKGNVNKTINKKVNLLKRVLKFNGFKNEYLNDYKKLKETKKRFDILNEKDLKKLLNYLNELPNDNLITLSEKLIILTFLDTGVRANELLHLEIDNINLDENQILLTQTKTSTERIVFFTHLTKELLKKYIKELPDRKYLFWNYRINKKYSYDNIRDLFKRIKIKLNLKKFHPHMLRHTMATLYIESGGKIEYLQQILGHTSLKTTEIYLHMSIKNTKKDYFKNFNY